MMKTIFDCDYNIDNEECPNCKVESNAIKEYKYVYPVIGEINGKVIIARIRKRSFRCINSECECATFI